MKKTINVNLGGRAFQITEEAYTKLNDYLNSISTCCTLNSGSFYGIVFKLRRAFLALFFSDFL